jgi:signal transduction histidine kinase
MVRSSPPRRGPGFSRLLLVVAAAFGLFVLFDIGLFGWLLFRSMSEREIEQMLLETRLEAESLAGRIASRAEQEGDLYTAIAVEQETQTYIDSIPRQRDIVRSVEIRDREGGLVFKSETRTSLAQPVGETTVLDPSVLEAPPVLDSPEVGGGGEVTQDNSVRQNEISVPDIEVAIGDLGTLRIGISPVELEERIAVLRRHLIRMTSAVGALTVALLLAAYFIGWWLWRRSRQLEVAAAEAERLAYVGTLASGLAHEIRNPLNSLNLNMQMMKEEIDAGQARGATVGRLLSITRSEISRLERLVTDFLSYARPRAPEREEIRPRDLFVRVREVVGGTVARRGGRLEVEDSSGALLRADVAQLTQLLLNLVQNAVAAAEEAGRPPRVLLSARRGDGDRVVLEVSDNGTGIAEEERRRIFDVFYSTRKGGTGLGLAIVERIVRNHDGELELDSVPGEGTTFRILLPEAPPGGEG